MRKKRRLLIMGVFLVGTGLFFGGFCGTKQRNCIGKVDFQLVEPLGDRLYGEIGIIRVEPGQRLAKDPTIIIKETSDVAYLRTKILWGGLSIPMREVLEENLTLENGWIKNQEDGFYYYQYPVAEGDEVCFFDMLTVPQNWIELQTEVSFCMKFQVEAAEIERIELLYNKERMINGWEIL